MKQKCVLVDLQQWRESVACMSCRQDQAGVGRVRASESTKTLCFKVLVLEAVEGLKTRVMGSGQWSRDTTSGIMLAMEGGGC